MDRHQGVGPGGGGLNGGRTGGTDEGLDRARQLETHVQGRPGSPARTGLGWLAD